MSGVCKRACARASPSRRQTRSNKCIAHVRHHHPGVFFFAMFHQAFRG
jgi:hypothetical protein